MSYLFYIVFVFLLIYSLLVLSFLYGWLRLPLTNPKVLEVFPFVSIIVAVRNEQKNLKTLIPLLLSQDYPNYEVIIIDDYSDDETSTLLHTWKGKIEILKNNYEQGKKFALRTGIEAAKGDILIFTDADCFIPRNWISSFVVAFEKYGADVILGNVLFNYDSLFSFSALMSLEFASLLASTAGAVGIGIPFMANGANIAMRKKIWNSAVINMEHPSGDDVFLLFAAKKQGYKIFFLKNKSLSVITKPPRSVKEFFYQRLRWASKTGHYNDIVAVFIALLVFFVNFFLLFSLFTDIKLFLYLFVVKGISDFFLLATYLAFYGRTKLLLWFIFEEILYIFYAVFIGFFSQFLSFEWKGRRFRT